jgi:hypothetical protein
MARFLWSAPRRRSAPCQAGGGMNRLLLTAAFLFVLWRVLAPAEPQVPPSLEAAAIRIVHEMTP